MWASTCTSQAWPISCHSDLLGVASAPRIRACLAASTKRDPKKTGKTKIEYDSITVYIMHILIPKERTTNMHWKKYRKTQAPLWMLFWIWGSKPSTYPTCPRCSQSHSGWQHLHLWKFLTSIKQKRSWSEISLSLTNEGPERTWNAAWISWATICREMSFLEWHGTIASCLPGTKKTTESVSRIWYMNLLCM